MSFILQVIIEWNHCKELLLRTSSELKEYKPLLSRLKTAEWKTLVYRVYLFRNKAGREYRLDDSVSLWEWDNYYKLGSSASHFPLQDKKKIVSSWKVFTAKYLVVAEKDNTCLEEKILTDHLSGEITKSLKNYQSPQEPVSEDKRIDWKKEKE